LKDIFTQTESKSIDSLHFFFFANQPVEHG